MKEHEEPVTTWTALFWTAFAFSVAALLFGLVVHKVFNPKPDTKLETKSVEAPVTPQISAPPVETKSETKPVTRVLKRKSVPQLPPRELRRVAPTPAPSQQAVLLPIDRFPPGEPPVPDCGGQVGHNFGPCPGYVHPREVEAP